MKKFKPEFGNLDHIRILEEMAKLKKEEEQYAEILKVRKESAAHRIKVEARKRRIRELMEIAKKKQV